MSVSRVRCPMCSWSGEPDLADEHERMCGRPAHGLALWKFYAKHAEPAAPNPPPEMALYDLVPTPSTERDEWLEWRRHGLGASDVAGVLGVSPWSSPWSVYAEKVGLSDGPDESKAMEFGKMAEPMLKAYFEKRTGLYIRGEQTWCSHPAEPWMRCTVDGFVYESEWETGRLGIAEFKATGEAPWDEPPIHYRCQAQWSMAVTGMSACWFGVLHMAFGRPDFRVYEFARNDVDIATLTARCRAFWFDNVVAGVAPPTDAHRATTEALAGAWEADDTETVEADDVLRRLVLNVASQKASIARQEKQLAALENELRAAFGEATALTYGVDAKGKPIVLATWRAQDRTTVDTKALRADMPDIAAKYEVTTTSRVLRLSKSKGN